METQPECFYPLANVLEQQQQTDRLSAAETYVNTGINILFAKVWVGFFFSPIQQVITWSCSINVSEVNSNQTEETDGKGAALCVESQI